MCEACCLRIFDGSDYKLWKVRLFAFLKVKKCYEVLTESESKGDPEKWKENNDKAMNYIYSALSDRQLQYVYELQTAKEIIEKLDELYTKKPMALIVVKKKLLLGIKMEDYDDPRNFFHEFETGVNELKDAGHTFTTEEKIVLLLSALPVEFDFLGDLLSQMEMDENAFEYLKSEILYRVLKKKKNIQEDSNSDVFKLGIKKESEYQIQKYQCYNCGKYGHMKRNCFMRNGSKKF